MRGRYVYGDVCSGALWTLEGRPRQRERRDGARTTTLEQVSSFGQDADGELYAVSLDGRILDSLRRG